MLANTIVFGAWPYLISFWMSPFILVLESLVFWGRHRRVIGLGDAFRWILAANAVSALVGLLFAGWGIRGFEEASGALRELLLLAWAWAMSVLLEYLVLRWRFAKIPWGRLAVTCIVMNIATYIPIGIYLFNFL